MDRKEIQRRIELKNQLVKIVQDEIRQLEAKLGEMLMQTERAKGGQPYQGPTGNKGEPVDPTLADLGLSKRESAEAQILPDGAEKR